MSLLPEVISELLFYRRSDAVDTRRFRDMRHNRHLCPYLEDQLVVIKNSFLKHHAEAYDVQGVHDQGTDVLIRYRDAHTPADSTSRFIAFQVKSFDDLRRPGYLKDIRSQCLQAKAEYRDALERYYVVLCTDINEHQGQMREISKALSTLERVVIIDPAHALAFLELNSRRISVVIDSMMREDDDVLRKATYSLGGLIPTQAAITVAIAARAAVQPNDRLDVEGLKADRLVQVVFDAAPDYDVHDYDTLEEIAFDDDPADLPATHEGADERQNVSDWKPEDLGRDFTDRWNDDLEIVAGRFLETDVRTGTMVADSEYLRPLIAIVLDAVVRYDYDLIEAERFVFDLTKVMERFGLRMPDENERLPDV